MVECNQLEMPVEISIRTIPHKSQAYDTVGNYWTGESGAMHITVSDMGNSDYEFLVAIHELVEAKLCQNRGISDAEITDFDEAFENSRKRGDLSEPGDHPLAPYQNEHNYATAVERLLCAALGLSWHDYEKAVQRLSA